jgi:hypothetical protein
MRGLTWWQWAKLTWTGWEARERYMQIDRRIGTLFDALAAEDDPAERAQLLWRMAAAYQDQAPLHLAGWGEDPDEDGIDQAQALRNTAWLYRLAADVETAIAHPWRGRRTFVAEFSICADGILDEMAAEPDLSKRMSSLYYLCDAVYGWLGSEAAEKVRLLPYPRTEHAQ